MGSSVDDRGGWHDADESGLPQAVLDELADLLPVAIVVIDLEARILFVNQHACELFGRTRSDLLGSSAFELIDPRDIDFTASMLAFAPSHPTLVMGPALVRFVDAAGASHFTQLRSHDCRGTFGIDGYVLTLTGESTHDLLVTSLASINADEDVAITLRAICRSARGDPLGCRAAMLVPAGRTDGRIHFDVIGDWPLPRELVDRPNTPWARTWFTGRTTDVLGPDDELLDPDVADALRQADLGAAWIRPVFGSRSELSALYVLWPPYVGPPSPNQERYLSDAVQLARLALEQVLHRRELERAARRDGLTGVPNRRAFKERLDGSRYSHDVLYIDLDHFKEANDTYGHEAGDRILAEVARRISRVIRRDDVLYRTGGDEFVVICADSGMALDEHGRVAARIIERLSAPFQFGRHLVRIGATVGIATGTSRTLPDTVRAADAALYAAKDRGRGCWHFADPAPVAQSAG